MKVDLTYLYPETINKIRFDIEKQLDDIHEFNCGDPDNITEDYEINKIRDLIEQLDGPRKYFQEYGNMNSDAKSIEKVQNKMRTLIK